MRVTISDSLAAQLEHFVTPTISIDDLVSLAVERVGHVGPQRRHVLLTEDDLNQLETRLGSRMPIGKPADLHRAVDALADVRINKISLQFSPAELREIEQRAAREGVEPELIVRQIIYAMRPQFFSVTPQPLPMRKGA